MPWADWTLLSALGGGFAYGVATLIIRERSLPFIISQREESMDFTLREDEMQETEEELSFTDARREFEKRLAGILDYRELQVKEMQKKAAEDRLAAEREELESQRRHEEEMRDAIAHEELKRQMEEQEYEAKKAREKAELEAFQERMEQQRKEEEERLLMLEQEEQQAAIEQERLRQEQIIAMEAQRQFEINDQTESEIQAVEADDKTKKDLEQRLNREGAKTGEVQLSLMWNDRNDLDLHVVCPSGERMHGGNKFSKCGGELDVDMNVRAESKKPVENVFWKENAPAGNYKVFVHFYKHHKKRRTRTTTTYKLIVNAGGEIKEYSDRIAFGDPIKLVAEFTMPEIEERAGFKQQIEERIAEVNSQVAAASTIEEYRAISLEDIPEETAEELSQKINMNIEHLEVDSAREEQERRFEDTKQMIMISADSEELENLDLTGFNEYETSRLNALMEQNLEVQRAEKFNRLMREIIMAEDFDQVDSIRIAGVNEEQRSSLEEAKEEAFERFHDQMYAIHWQSIESAQTVEELDAIEFRGISEMQLQSLSEHKENRASALEPTEDILDIQSELEEDAQPLRTMIPQSQPETSEEILSEEISPVDELLPETAEEPEEESFDDLLMEFGEQYPDDEESVFESASFDDGDELEGLLAAALEGTEEAETELSEKEIVSDEALDDALESILQPSEGDSDEEGGDGDDATAPETENQSTVEYVSSSQILIEKIIVNENILEALNGRLQRENVERAEYEISLMWNNKNDLDLHVNTAKGDHIDVNNRLSSCNGTLVHTMNARTTSKKPIEHIIWKEKPPAGKYVVSVDHFKKNRGFGSRDPTRFLVAVNIAGNISAWEGHINSNDDMATICEFNIE